MSGHLVTITSSEEQSVVKKSDQRSWKASQYDVYYRVHAQNIGWLGWAKNGESAGTEGLALRLEAIKIMVVPKGAAAPGSTERPFVKK